MAGLSISRAWDETKARIAADGRLMVVVALALIALPLLVTGVLNPQQAGADPTLLSAVIAFIGALLALIGQLAIIRLAIGPSVSVGEAIAHGARRMPIYFVAVVLLVLIFIVAAIPFIVALVASGVDLQTPAAAAASPLLLLLMFLYLAFAVFVGIRMLMSSPVASEEAVGPVTILRRSWDLTGGHFWRLFGFMLLFLIGAGIAIAAISWAVAFVAVVLLGPIEPMSASALLVSLVDSLVNAVVSLVLAVMLARIYLQLVGDDVERVSVPSSGT